MPLPLQGLRGMNDVLPGHPHLTVSRWPFDRLSACWQHLEHAILPWLTAYGYQQIRTPILEQTALFSRAIGEHTDIVEKEMYSFEDALNQDQLTLRPEGTTSCVRACIEHGLLYKTTQRLWYWGPMFRHERPQKGRYRQFHQLGVEAFGFEEAAIDAELILMLHDFWKRLPITGLTLELNTLGNEAERIQYRHALIAYLEAQASSLDHDGQRRLYTNPLRVLDSKNQTVQAIVQQAPMLSQYLGKTSQTHFETVCTQLDTVGIAYRVNPRLVRGLDYYNSTVFEWTSPDLGAQATVAAGGRYDTLVEQLGGKPCPAVGFAIGMERLLLLMQTQALPISVNVPDIYLIHEGSSAAGNAFRLAKQLREAGLNVLLHAGGGQIKSQFKRAQASGAPFAVVLREEDVQRGTATLTALLPPDQTALEKQSVLQQQLSGVIAEQKAALANSVRGKRL